MTEKHSQRMEELAEQHWEAAEEQRRLDRLEMQRRDSVEQRRLAAQQRWEAAEERRLAAQERRQAELDE